MVAGFVKSGCGVEVSVVMEEWLAGGKVVWGGRAVVGGRRFCVRGGDVTGLWVWSMFITPEHDTHTVRSLSTPSRSCQPGAAVRLCVVWQRCRPRAPCNLQVLLLPSHYDGGLFD